MDALPVELCEQIFAYILPITDQKKIVPLPVSTKLQRIAIYNLRLSCQRLRALAWPSFIRIIEDVPTTCSEKCMHYLASLIALPEIYNGLTCLALKDDRRLPQLIAHDSWLRGNFLRNLVDVMTKIVQFRHLICVMETNWLVTRDARVQMICDLDGCPDPMSIIECALVVSKANTYLESIISIAWRKALPEEDDSERRELPTPLSFPNLRHLAIYPTNQLLPGLDVRHAPKLSTLQVIIDDWLEVEHIAAPHHCGIPEIGPRLREYTISGGNRFISTDVLLELVALVYKQDTIVQVVTIQDMVIIWDINYEIPQYSGQGRFERLIFSNAKYCYTDNIMNSGPSEPKALDRGWKALPMLLGRTKDIRIVDKTGNETTLMHLG